MLVTYDPRVDCHSSLSFLTTDSKEVRSLSQTTNTATTSTMVLRSSKSVPTPNQNKAPRRNDHVKKPRASASSSVQRLKQGGSASQQTPKKKKRPKESGSDNEHPPVPAIQEPVKRIVKPGNQLELSEQALEEDVTRILTGDDPNVPKNVCKFSFKDRCYKPDPPGQGDNMAIHFSLQGNSIHVDSAECKKYQEANSFNDQSVDAKETTSDTKITSESQMVTPTTSSGNSTTSSGTGIKGEHTKNQFNYSERGSQTFNNPMKSRGVHTEPPPMTQYQDDVSQSKIYDSYKSECLISMMEHQQEGNGDIRSFEDKLASIVIDKGEIVEDRSDTIHSEHMENALKVMERLVNQNAEDDIFQDFKYWEDASDQYRQHGEGTLLPLWKFSTERTNRKQVTSLCWNPRYNDLFAVGYGSYDFMRQGNGIVCCFSLKNTSYPEYAITTESGVMCLDFHPQHPSLLALGCYDGTVLVYDIGNGRNKPIYSSSSRYGKHSDPVWQVCWHDSGYSKDFNFYSVSSDGKVANWTMSKNELKMETVMQLKLVSSSKEATDEPSLCRLAGGSSFDFSETLENKFLVGTEEGNIHECSKAYSGQYIKTYDGHHMGVHTVKWNPFHEDIFISCSSDWTVKVS